MQNWIVIDETYLNYLRQYEQRIPYSNYGQDKFKPFFGVLFEKDDLAYVTQISHAQPRHQNMKNSPDFLKIYLPDRNQQNQGRLVAVVNLNYMFPVPKHMVNTLEYKDIESHRTFTSELEKSQYIDLLQKEMAQINTLGLERRAVNLYERKQKYPTDFVSQRCLDFTSLETIARQYK